MNRKTSLRLIRRLGLALAVMAIAAPAAQAMPVISQEGGTEAPAQVLPTADDLHATVPHLAVAAPQVLLTADDLHASVPHVAMPSVTSPDNIVRPVSNEPTDSLGRPLSRPEPTDSLGRPLSRPEPTDSLGRPLGRRDVVQPPSDVVSASSGLDWTQVGIGFFAFGMLLLGGGALIISRQNRRSRLAAA